MSVFAKKGSKENPIVLGIYEAKEIQLILEKAEMEYSYADAEDKGAIRAEVRERIFKRWPQLYDHCHVEIVTSQDDYWRDQTDRWFERICKKVPAI